MHIREEFLKRAKLLIVEDVPSVRQMYCGILEQAGHTICEAENYDQAVALMDQSIDLALVDINLGGRSGIEVLKKNRALFPDCPVIMVSAYANKINAINALREGAVDYLEKPVDPHELLHVVNRWLSNLTLKREVMRLREERESHHELRESETRYRNLIEALPDAILVQCENRIVFSNSASAKIFRTQDIDALIGKSLKEFVSSGSWEVIASLIPRILQEMHPVPAMEEQLKRLDGELFDAEISMMPTDFMGKPAIQVIIRDISKRKYAEKQLEHLAHIDLVTNLPNRSLFIDRLKQSQAQAKRRNQQLAVLFLDLDFFKAINDTLGHECGDQVLRSVADRLVNNVRDMDTVARYAGDEYTLLLMDIEDAQGAASVAQKLLDALAQPHHLNNNDYFISASIGISIYPMDGETAETLINSADKALYLAKKKGRNCYEFYTRKLGEDVQNRLQQESQLRMAIQNNEVTCLYQPKVNLSNGKVIGLEALLHWQQREGEQIPPAALMQMAEETGMIRQINEWTLRHACDQIFAWKSSGLSPVPVSLNLNIYYSPHQLEECNPLKIASNILDKSGLDPSFLEFEIAENSIMQCMEKHLAAMEQLRTRGVRIGIDNFGTGLSCLSHLKCLPLDTLKIDASFIRNLPGDPNDAALCTAIIRMAHSMNLMVVAEGVETEEQLDFLRSEGCDAAQGSFLYHPMSAEDVASLLSDHD